MKRTLIILFGLTLFYVVGCSDDFVEVEPDGFNDTDFFNNQQEYESALIGAYDMLQSTFWNVLTGIVASPDYAAGGDAFNYDQATLQNINLMIHTPADENQLRSIWGLMYAGINRANFILEFEDKTDFSGKEEIIAETYFLRAYYTFELVKYFGNVPLKLEERNGVMRIANERIFPEEEFGLERVADIATAYSLIEEDLKEAIPNLPVTQDFPYEATKSAAQALLGKVYLYHGTFDQSKFADAASELNEVISSNQYSLTTGDNYMMLFEGEGENSSEAVFEIQYTGIEAAGWGCIECSQGTYFPQFCGPRSPYNNSEFSSGWGFCLPSLELYDLFEDGDARRDVTFFDLRDDQDSYSQSRDDTGLFNRKYMPRKAADGVGADPLNYSQNYRSIRYADVLLMAAEAEAQSGGANAENYLNEVRARAYGDNSHDFDTSEGTLLEAIYTERRKELGGEGHGFFDLVRTGRAASTIEGFTPNKNEVFPIPLIELQLANAEERWGNPGY
ncbi:RagB/SusD family nutrient uptake outer membrane protein [Winogradskyella vincentii]|uniref:RagB/SusD family nutrient uptake outer membrane protein n=1 Tax=Winogradskyella vincentii TaxID=2877122 RepID=A0ABS7Y2G2_9FLAO|nr:RagB/SusD family nutrient uptake outer membrane protein [Winogradskyella vincentii]MCA0154129.1 RagB/SusD family nutrient uptake outer membrane protein [Winogradskyella vincentii]